MNESETEIEVYDDNFDDSDDSEDVYTDDIEKYDIEQAKMLLKNIRTISDISGLDMPPRVLFLCGLSDKKKTLQDWLEWYADQFDITGVGTGSLESLSLEVILYLRDYLVITYGRTEEGFRKLVNVLDRRGIKIKALSQEVNRLNKENKTLAEETERIKRSGYIIPQMEQTQQTQQTETSYNQDKSYSSTKTKSNEGGVPDYVFRDVPPSHRKAREVWEAERRKRGLPI